jgi:hypothetical protein
MDDPLKADSQEQDAANIRFLLIVSQIVKTIRLLTNIAFLSYFTGLIIYIYSDSTKTLIPHSADP